MINILGINLNDDLSLEKFLSRFSDLMKNGKQNYIVTPNPEIILKAQKDEEYFYILNEADLSLPDGFGLTIAAALMGKRIKRLTGSDSILEILSLAEKEGYKVLIANNKNGLSSASDISLALAKKYPRLNFLIEDMEFDAVFSPKKDFVNFSFSKDNFLTRIVKKIEKRVNEKLEFLVIDKVYDFAPDILICNFGAPKQEKFIFHNLNKIPSLKVAIGIGGALDFITGKIKRAPKFMRKLGLEWLYRLIKQPERFKRIFKAVFVFTFKFIHWYFVTPFFYRKNVACFLYKHEALPYTALENKTRDELEQYQVLLVERTEDPGHWQLPQGGTDHERIMRAGSRELYEELGIEKFYPKKYYKNVYKYKIDFRAKYGYKGQKQSLLIAEFAGDDSEIKINFWDHSAWKWVKVSDLSKEVHPVRRNSAEVFVNKFKKYLNNN